jgi:hypothetical protein
MVTLLRRQEPVSPLLTDTTLSDHPSDVALAGRGDLAAFERLYYAHAGRATIAVATFNGEFASDYPVTTDGRRGRRFTADLGGGGGAQVELESFQGTMRIQKPRSAQ